MSREETIRWFEKQIADLEAEKNRLVRSLAEYKNGDVESPEVGTRRVRPGKLFSQVLAGGVRMTRNQLFAAIKERGWSATYEGREFTKAINANLAAGNIAFDGSRYYIPVENVRDPQE